MAFLRPKARKTFMTRFIMGPKSTSTSWTTRGSTVGTEPEPPLQLAWFLALWGRLPGEGVGRVVLEDLGLGDQLRACWGPSPHNNRYVLIGLKARPHTDWPFGQPPHPQDLATACQVWMSRQVGHDVEDRLRRRFDDGLFRCACT
jgi:hypothetical protein